MIYLTKYLTKSIGLNEHATDAQRDHAHRLHAELRITPCSPRCAIWLLYGIQPKGARHSLTPGCCKGKAHQPEHLGIAGRRVLVSRKWSNKTINVPLCSTSTRIAQRLVSAGQSLDRPRRPAGRVPTAPVPGVRHREHHAAGCGTRVLWRAQRPMT